MKITVEVPGSFVVSNVVVQDGRGCSQIAKIINMEPATGRDYLLERLYEADRGSHSAVVEVVRALVDKAYPK